MKRDKRALDLAGIDLGGAKVLTTKLPEAAPAPRKPPGVLLLSFEVPHRPCPWRAATVTKSGVTFKDKRLVAWQETVKRYAAAAMAGRAPYPFPVRLDLSFHLSRKPGSPPDTSNLVKAFEDSLQGVVIVNDRQVCSIKSDRYLGSIDGATADVYSQEDQ